MYMFDPQKHCKREVNSTGNQSGISRSTIYRVPGIATLVAGVLIISMVLANWKTNAQAGPTFTLLHSFSGPDGAQPYAPVIQDAAGNLYGTTWVGGTYNQGVVFQLSLNGTETVLHHFAGGSDGSNPYGGLIQDSAGNLYGTTVFGGAYNDGAVFKLSPTGSLTVLHSFGLGADGAGPYGGVIQDSSGNLFGTTTGGGAYGYGVVFELDPVGEETVLYNFSGKADGGSPYAALTRDNGGSFYGTATVRGDFATFPCNGQFPTACGVVFNVTRDGEETVLHDFTGQAGGGGPFGGVIRDKTGDVYGTTLNGGSFGFEDCAMSEPGGCGVVFKLNPAGTEQVLWTFGGPSGEFPESSVIRDAAGNLYGTTSQGGLSDAGVVFKLTPSGQEIVLHNFTGTPDGQTPHAGLIQDSAGNLYGTAFGGANGQGVVFKVTP